MSNRLVLALSLLAALPVLAPAQPEHWSLRPVARPTPPAVADAQWVRTPIDRFILARLERSGLRPSPRADRATLARRMALVMHGLPPSPEDARAFETDLRGDAWERLVHRTLASPRYGERWGRHWLDVVRFAETNGFETNTPRANAWPYRDWVIRAFNDDLPWDRFVTAQVAGDVMGDDAATGFLVAGPYDTVKSPDPVLTATQRQDELADIVNTTSTAFLGLTIACARCHDHKFDPITQKDYFAVQAMLAGVQHGDRPLRSKDDGDVQARIEELDARAGVLREQLEALPRRRVREPSALLIDDADTGRVPGVALLAPKKGHGTNPPGAARGYKNDLGGPDRALNVSGGSYTCWEGRPAEDVIAYSPGVTGRHRIWISWGAGWHTHAEDTRYVLLGDDGETLLATVDQRRFADGTLDIVDQPLWSGLKDVGVHVLGPTSRIVVRAGATARPVTADVVIVAPEAASDDPIAHLRDPLRADVNEERFPALVASAVRLTSLVTNSTLEPCVDELEVWEVGEADEPARNVALAAAGSRASSSGNYAGDPKHRLEHVNDGSFGNPRSWISNTHGTGWVRVDFSEPKRVDRITWGRDRERRYSDRLAISYVIEALADEEWVTVATSATRLPFGVDVDRTSLRLAHLPDDRAAAGLRIIEELREVEAAAARLRARPQVYAGRFEQPQRTHLLRRGDPMDKKEVVTPDVPAVLGATGLKEDASESERRVALARVITDPKGPLTARVIVNRIWQHHFGEGLVDTPSDFGRMGTVPSHPELLDWLASELVAHGWSLKHIQHLILSSATWAQASSPRPDGLRIDADARLLWRFPPRRLESEAIRDGILAVSGELDLTMGGPGFEVFEPNTNYVRVYEPRKTFGKDAFRRMVYARVIRMERDATFGAFDTPDAGQVCPKRTRSTTALQALNLLNAPFVLERADAFAKRLTREVGEQTTVQVRRAFELAFGRPPDKVELDASVRLVNDHGLPALCRAVLNANEFLFVR